MQNPTAIALLLLLLSAPAIAQDAPSLDGDVMPPGDMATPPTPPAPPHLSIIYEGATGGISGGDADLSADPLLSDLLLGLGGWVHHAAGWGAFLKDGRWLLQPDGGVQTFTDRVAPALTPIEDAARDVEILQTEREAFVVWPPDEVTLGFLEAALSSDPLRAPPRRRTVRISPAAVADDAARPVLLVGGENTLDPETALVPTEWEARLRSVYRHEAPDGDTWVYSISRVVGEGSRRAAMVRSWRGGPSLYLSAGESIEGRSFLQDRELSLQREETLGAWKSLGLDALAPGADELLAGIDALREEAARAGTALVSVNLVDPQGEPVFEPWHVQEVGGYRVLLIGWTDPDVLHRLPPDRREGLVARGPEAVLDALAATASELAEPPHLVVLFGNNSRELAGQLAGVDLVLGDFSNIHALPRWLELDPSALAERANESSAQHAPTLVSRLGGRMVGRVDLTFDPGSGALSGLRHLRATIGEDEAPDPDLLVAIQTIRQRVYAGLEDVLIPDLASLTPPRRTPPLPERVDSPALALLATNLLMDRTGADVGLLRPLPEHVTIPGGTPSLYVDASLSVVDEVVVVEVTGAQLKSLLAVIQTRSPTPGQRDPKWADAPALRAWSSGVVYTPRKTTVRGRVVQNTDVLLVATTTFLADDPLVKTILKRSRVWDSFRGKGWVVEPTGFPGGHRWSLHSLVKGGLVQLHQLDDTFGSTYSRRLAPLLTDPARKRTGRFTLELDSLAFGVTGSRGLGDRTGYENSRETRVNQVDSLTTTLRGRVALTWDDRIGSVSGFAEGAFGGSTIADIDEPIELEDDLEFGAETQLRIVSIAAPKGRIPLSFFVQGAFDTEFTAGLDEAGAKLPLQRIVRGTAGTTFGRYLMLKELKAGLFLEYDLGAEVGPLAPGGAVSAKTERVWGPVRWANLLDFKGYFPTPVDTDEDLAFTLQLRTDLGIVPLKRLIPGLSVGAFADMLLFQGKVDTNDGVRAHLLLGAALTYDADLRPPVRLR